MLRRSLVGALLLLALPPIARANYGPWEPAGQKTALMVVAAHPDDEHIFFGGALPYYAAAKHLQVAMVDMVTDYTVCMPADTRGRKEELRNAAWHSGVRVAPQFADFNDDALMPGGVFQMSNCWDAWDGNLNDGVADANNNAIPDGREAGALYIAKQIRTFRPEVILSHDLNGEYGHSAHRATAICTADAFDLAADPSVNIDGLAPWSAKKLYLHLYDQHPLFHTGWETPLDSLGGKTARQVADESLDMHVSQGEHEVSTFYRQGENYDGTDSERWGLYASRVGWDPTPPATAAPADLPGGYCFGDFFANVDEVDADTYREGDANFDGRINFGDLVLLAQHYGQGNAPLSVNAADFNLDGTTNFADLVTLAQHYGGGDRLPPGNAMFAADWALARSLVPEPTVGVAIAAAAGLYGRRRSPMAAANRSS